MMDKPNETTPSSTALAAGCVAIHKPSELASITCLELGEVCKEVGLPPGALNILTGLGQEAGAPLVSHPHVDKETVTNFSATPQVMQQQQQDMHQEKSEDP